MGICNDLRSGSQVDFCVLHLDGTSKYTRYVVAKGELQEYFEKQREHHEDDDAGTNLGVNVFALKSKRVLWVSETESKRLQSPTASSNTMLIWKRFIHMAAWI